MTKGHGILALLLLRHQDGHVDRQEQEADAQQQTRASLHDRLVADRRLRLRHPHRRHQGHRAQRAQERAPLPEAAGRRDGLPQQEQGGAGGAGQGQDLAQLHLVAAEEL